VHLQLVEEGTAEVRFGVNTMVSELENYLMKVDEKAHAN
jgi:hypothetical protein